MRFGPRSLDLGNPVNRAHPLAYGLVGAWFGLPHNRGGSTLFDAVGGNHGTLTSGPTWDAGVNGFAAVRLDGVNDYVNYSGADFNRTGLAGWSLTLAVIADNWSSSPQLVNTGGTMATWDLTATSQSFQAAHQSNTYSVNSGLTLPTGSPLVFTHTTSLASGSEAFINGRSVGTNPSADGSLGGSVSSVRIGGNVGGATNFFAGRILGMIYHQRALSASEAWVLYAEFVTGFPTLLNRRSSATWFVGSGGGGGGNRRRRFLTCAGG